MLHALRNHIRKFDTDDVTMFIGSAHNGEALEINVLDFDSGPHPINERDTH